MVRNSVGQVHQRNAVMFETIHGWSQAGAYHYRLEGDVFLAILILVKQK